MAKTYLDENGLATLWGKIKTYVTNAVKVTGVKGNSENSYRTGNVNLTAANVGAVATSGNETVSGNKTFTGTTTIEATSVVRNQVGQVIVANANAVIQSPIPKYIWHDVFAFNRATTPKYYTTSDGTTWTEATLDKRLFIHKEAWGKINILDSTISGSRWTWIGGGLAYCSATWLVIGVAYANPISKFNVLLETSSGSDDSATWTTLVDVSGISVNQNPIWIRTNTTSTNNIRLTITRNSESASTTTLPVTSIRWLTTRWGDQGKGSEFEYPYQWNENNTIFPISNNVSDLGGTSYKWKNLFATTLNASNMGDNTALIFPQTSGSETGIRVTNSANDRTIFFGIGSGQINRGIWDSKLNKWIIHANDSNVYLNNTVVPDSPKFTDTVTTATTTGSGNAVTAVSASNGALTITKGSTFLTQHQSNANLGHGYHTVTTPTSGVYVINASGYNLVEGSRISVLFSNAVTDATPKLNVNNTGAKSIYYNGSVLNPTAVTYANAVIDSKSVVTFVYQGTYFAITAIENPKRIVVPCYQLDSTGGNTTKIMKTSNYTLCAGSLFTASFLYDNTASNTLSLNINGTGAKTLFINGKASSASNCTLPAGTYLIYYNGTNYYVRTDGKYPGASSLPTREDISSDFISSNFRVVIGGAIRYGKVVELELLIDRSSAWANGSSGDITTTLTSNHLPYKPVSTTVMWSNGVLIGTIAGEGGYVNNTSGDYGQGYVLFRNVSGASISKDTESYISFTFRYIYDDGNITTPDLSGWQLS